MDEVEIGLGKIGPLSAELARRYEALLRGADEGRMAWLSPVWPEGEGRGEDT